VPDGTAGSPAALSSRYASIGPVSPGSTTLSRAAASSNTARLAMNSPAVLGWGSASQAARHRWMSPKKPPAFSAKDAASQARRLSTIRPRSSPT
jgi:hypothetical protein